MADDRTYAMLAKPVSSECNLRCEYCYYYGKKDLPEKNTARMSDDILALYIKQNIDMHGSESEIEFAWHGGEPTIAGLNFYRKAVELQKKYGAGRKITNSIQTNGILLTEEWCRFFKECDFKIGVSIDGPEEIHNAYRKKADGTGSFADTVKGAELLKKHGISFNILATVNRINMEQPLETYRFLKGLADYVQFLPVVERMSDAQCAGKNRIAPFSVTPEGYGRFLCTVWDEWIRKDIGRKHIQIFDVTLENLSGRSSSLCVHNPLCGHSGCVEADGDVYSCDRFVFPDFKLGNIQYSSLYEIMEKNRNFGMHKTYGLADECFECPYVKLCFGGCPKDRFNGKKNYLCAGYKMFFSYIMKYGRRNTGENPDKGGVRNR